MSQYLVSKPVSNGETLAKVGFTSKLHRPSRRGEESRASSVAVSSPELRNPFANEGIAYTILG